MKKFIALLFTAILFTLPLTAHAQSSPILKDSAPWVVIGGLVFLILIGIIHQLKKKDTSADEYDDPDASFNHPPLHTVSEDDVRAAGNSLKEKFEEIPGIAATLNYNLNDDNSGKFISLEERYYEAMRDINQNNLPQSSELLSEILRKITAVENDVVDYTEQLQRRQNKDKFFRDGGYAEGKRLLANPGRTIDEINKLIKSEKDTKIRRRLENSRNIVQSYKDGSSSISFGDTVLLMYLFGVFDHTKDMDIPQGNWNNDPNDVPEIQSDNEHIENSIADDPNLESTKIAEEASIGNEEVKDDNFEKDYEEVNREETNEEIQNNDEETNNNDTNDTDSGDGDSSDD